jgi:hypothetical protein
MKKITDMTPEERRLAQILAETIDERLSKTANQASIRCGERKKVGLGQILGHQPLHHVSRR